jgi:hypothetical protein
MVEKIIQDFKEPLKGSLILNFFEKRRRYEPKNEL